MDSCARGAFIRTSILDNDGRCVQRTGTHSPADNDGTLLGIPRSRRIYKRRSPPRGSADSESLPHCSARGARDLYGHHRPVIDPRFPALVGHRRSPGSHALSDLTRQVTPRVKNGHAPRAAPSAHATSARAPHGAACPGKLSRVESN
jgi:hypothetical protein